MFNYKVTSEVISSATGDTCLRILVGDFEVSVAFHIGTEGPERHPSDIRIFDKRDGDRVFDITETVYGRDHVPVNSFADISFAVALVESKYYNW